MATKSMDLGQVMGTSAYQEAQAGGYTGTKEEFQKELAGISKAGKPFIIEGTLTEDDGTLSVDKTRAEVKAAVQANRAVIMRILIPNTTTMYELQLIAPKLDDSSDTYSFCAVLGMLVFVAYIDYTDAGASGEFLQVGLLEVGDTIPSPPGTASAGTSDEAARADHVHPKEVSDDDRTAWNGKASKPTVTTVTLTAAGWNATTKKQTVTVTGVLADTSKQVIWVTQTTEAAIDAYLEAGIVPVAQAANAVTLRADTIPTADITVNIVVQEVQ